MKNEKRNKFIRFRNGLTKQHHEKCSLEQQVEKLKRIKDEEIRIAERDKQLKNMYHDYLSFGFKYVCEKYDYKKSRENLIIAFKRHVPEYDKNALLKISVKLKKENDGYKQSSNNKKLSKEEKIQMFTEMYEDFKLNGFDFVVEKYDWKSSRNALVMNFKNYVANYIPTPTSRWNNKNT